MEQKTDKTIFGFVKLRALITFAIAVVTFAFISWIYFYPNDVNGDVLQQSDVMQGAANGHEGLMYAQKTGEISRWTDALFGGMPTFQIHPSYKSTPLLSWVSDIYDLNFPTPVAWVFIMMLGFYILMLAFDVKWYLAILGAVAYGFSSYFFILIGAGHIWKLLTLAYIPPTIAGIVWCYRGHYLGGGALAALFAALQLMSNHIQMTYYSLFIIVALVIAYLVVAIKNKKMGQWGIATGTLAVAALLAVAANAPSLYLSYKYSKETIRGGHSELTAIPNKNSQQPTVTPTKNGLDKDYITQWSYGKDETFTLMIPNVKGGASMKPEHGANKPLTLAETDKAEKMSNANEIQPQDFQNLQYFLQYFGDQPMTNGPVYVGILICALFLLGCAVVKGPVKWALVVITLLSVFLSWGHNMMWLTNLFIDYFPLYNKFRTVASILVIAELTMPVLAVLALQKALTEEDFFKKHSRAIYVSFGICAVVCLFTWLVPSSFGSYSQQEYQAYVVSGQLQQVPTLGTAIETIRHSMVSSDALRSLAILVIGFIILFAYLKLGKINAMTAGLAIAAIVLIDMYTVNKRYLDQNTFISHNEVAPTDFTPRTVDKQIMQDTAQNYRVLDQQHFAEAMPSYFHKTVGGYHAAKLTRYNDLIDRQISKGNMQVFNMLNTKYVIMSDSTFTINPQALGNAWFVDTLTYVNSADQEMKFLDHFNAATHAVADAKFKSALGTAAPKQAGDTIYETTYAPNKLTYHYHSAKGGLAVFSEVYFPWGWQATVDGKDMPIGRVNYVLRAMNLPAGNHTIVFKFDPQEVHSTESIATTAIILIFIAIIATVNFEAYKGIRRKKKEEETKEAEPAK
jgi:hypothetical protein